MLYFKNYREYAKNANWIPVPPNFAKSVDVGDNWVLLKFRCQSLGYSKAPHEYLQCIFEGNVVEYALIPPNTKP